MFNLNINMTKGQSIVSIIVLEWFHIFLDYHWSDNNINTFYYYDGQRVYV